MYLQDFSLKCNKLKMKRINFIYKFIMNNIVKIQIILNYELHQTISIYNSFWLMLIKYLQDKHAVNKQINI